MCGGEALFCLFYHSAPAHVVYSTRSMSARKSLSEGSGRHCSLDRTSLSASILRLGEPLRLFDALCFCGRCGAVLHVVLSRVQLRRECFPLPGVTACHRERQA